MSSTEQEARTEVGKSFLSVLSFLREQSLTPDQALRLLEIHARECRGCRCDIFSVIKVMNR